MARAEFSVKVEFKDMARMRLFIWELHALADEMRISADPHADKLERALDRFLDGGNDEGSDPSSEEDTRR